MSVLALFWPNLLLLTIATPALALLGAQVSARGRLLSVFTLSQAAVLVFLLCARFAPIWPEAAVIALTAVLITGLGELRRQGRVVDPLRELSIGLMFLLASGAVLALSPDLESRRTAGFFGDPSLLTSWECLGLGVFFGIVAAGLYGLRRHWLREAFDRHLQRSRRPASLAENAVLALILSVAVVKLGLIHTVMALALPAFFARSCSSFAGHQRFLLIQPALAAAVGFALSLGLENLPSVYVVGGVLAASGVFWISVRGWSASEP